MLVKQESNVTQLAKSWKTTGRVTAAVDRRSRDSVLQIENEREGGKEKAQPTVRNHRQNRLRANEGKRN